MNNNPTITAWGKLVARVARRRAREAAARCAHCGGKLDDGRCTVCGWTAPKKDAA